MDRLERLTNLMLVLLQTRRPLSLREIADAVPGYPQGQARRQAFERDKRTLREEGFPVSTEMIGGADQQGYRIRPEDFYLPDLELEPDEHTALNVAVAEVHLGDPSSRDALWRLGLPASVEGHRALADLAPLEALPVLFDAIRARALVQFPYRGEHRRVAPARLRFAGGRWYLVGYDLDRDAGRTFRVDRMQELPAAGAPRTAVLPDGFDADAAFSSEPAAGEGSADEVTVRVDALHAGRVVQQLGPASVVAEEEGGSVVVRLAVTYPPGLRSWILAMGPHAEVVGPPERRAEIVSWLRAMVDGAGETADTVVVGGAGDDGAAT